MEYDITVDRKGGYLHVRVAGDNTPATVVRYLTEVHEACVREDCSSVLVEEHLTGPSLGVVDVFRIVSEGSADARKVLDRVAFVDTNPSHDGDHMAFAETVAVNRGLNMRVFASVSEAERWLDALRGVPPSS